MRESTIIQCYSWADNTTISGDFGPVRSIS